jgi:hypothetical protein
MTPGPSRIVTTRVAPARILAAGAFAFLLATATAACSGTPSPTTASPSASLGPRPPSPAKVEILQPAANTTVTGTTVHVVLKLTGATIVTQTSTNIEPDKGHVHLYVNNILVSMNYGLEQDITVQPGTIALKAEFVAADHAPFDPRVWSNEVIFSDRA